MFWLLPAIFGTTILHCAKALVLTVCIGINRVRRSLITLMLLWFLSWSPHVYYTVSDVYS